MDTRHDVVSEVNESFHYNAEEWLVSVLNTGDKLGGHSIVVVEGLKKADISSVSLQFEPHLEKFVGQYEISAVSEDAPSSSLNPKGYICNVKCTETKEVTRPGGYKQFPSRSYKVDAEDASKMITSIKEDEQICLRARRGEGAYPPYQKLGTDHPFVRLIGNVNDGHSCASWCARKLEIATGGKHNGAKPKISAGQCLIL